MHWKMSAKLHLFCLDITLLILISYTHFFQYRTSLIIELSRSLHAGSQFKWHMTFQQHSLIQFMVMIYMKQLCSSIWILLSSIILTLNHIFISSWTSDAIWWHRSGLMLVQVMACSLEATRNYLSQCWPIISEVWCKPHEGNFTRDT